MVKRKKLIVNLSLVLIVFSVILLGAWVDERKFEGEPEISFGVLGDIHTNTKKLDKIIKDYNEIDKNMDTLILNGDIVDQGLSDQYNSINQILMKNKTKLPKSVIKNIGNHEFFNYATGKNSKEKSEVLKQRNLEFTGHDKTYFQRFIKGYNFIFLGTEETHTDRINAVQAYISKEQKDWLKGALKSNYEKNKPIFIFLHQPMINGGNLLVEEDKEESIRDIIREYPEAIVFYSHNHTSLIEKDIFKEDGITMVNTGAVDYTIKVENGQIVDRNSDVSYGLYIKVKGNQVTLNGRNFLEEKFVYNKGIPKLK
ncbi:MAG: metallophosphoesterase family protein [Clostridium sp.]